MHVHAADGLLIKRSRNRVDLFRCSGSNLVGYVVYRCISVFVSGSGTSSQRRLEFWWSSNGTRKIPGKTTFTVCARYKFVVCCSSSSLFVSCIMIVIYISSFLYRDGAFWTNRRGRRRCRPLESRWQNCRDVVFQGQLWRRSGCFSYGKYLFYKMDGWMDVFDHSFFCFKLVTGLSPYLQLSSDTQYPHKTDRPVLV